MNRTLATGGRFKPLVLAVAAIMLAACGGDDEPSPRPQPTNTAPTADAGDVLTVNPEATVTLDGSGSSDTENSTLRFAWEQTNTGTQVTLSSTSVAEPTFAAPVVTEDTDLTFQLTVTDAGGLTARASVTITINAPPTADAGDAQTVAPGVTVTLDGGDSSDPGDGTIEYAWTVPADSAITLSDADVADPTFTAPSVTEETEYVFTLTVTDDNDATDTATVTITVIDDEAPTLQSVGFAEGDAPTGTLVAGDEIRLVATFSKAVVVRGTPRFKFTVGGEERIAAHQPPTSAGDQESGSTKPVFVYVVQAGDDLEGGIEIPANPLQISAEDDEAIVSADDPEAAVDENIPTGSFEVSPELATEIEIKGGDAPTPAPTNARPTANAGENAVANEGTVATLDGSGSTDPDDDTLMFSWAVPANTDITLAGTAAPTFTAPAVNEDTDLTFTLTVSDPGGLTGTDEVVITIRALPIADAGDGTTVNEGAPATLDGSGSTDPDGDTLAYVWTAPAGADITLAGADATTATFTAPAVDMNTDLTFTLTVSNATDNTADTDTVTITINARPTAVATSEPTVNAGAVATLTGSNSSDPGDTLTYTWRQTEGEPAVSLSDTAAENPTFTAPELMGATEDATLTFELTVTDENNFPDTATVSITVNAPPTAMATTDEATVNAGTVATLIGSGSTDPGDGTPTYAWRQTSGTPMVTLSDPTAADPTFTAPGLTGAVEDATLTFELTVTDAGGLKHADDVQITINAPPSAMVAGAPSLDASANLLVTLDGSGSTDPGGTPTYAWRQTSGTPMVTLSDDTIANPIFTAPATLGGTTLAFELTVRDARGLTDTASVSVVVEKFPDPLSASGLHGGGVRAVSISRDGSLAVSGGNDGIVRLWNVNAGEEIRFPDTDFPDGMRSLGYHEGAVYAVAISADGRRAISGGIDGVLRLWNTQAGDGAGYGTELRYPVSGSTTGEMRSLGPNGVWIYAVALNADGSRAASGGFDGKLRHWNTQDAGSGAAADAGAEILYGTDGDESLDSYTFLYASGVDTSNILPISVYAVALNDDGTLVLSGVADGRVRLWDTDPEPMNGTPAAPVETTLSDGTATGPTYGVALSGDGTRAAWGSADNMAYVWDLTNDAALHTLSGHTADVTSVSLNDDGSRLLSADGAGQLRLWDTAAGTRIHGTRQHTDYVWSAGLSGSGNRILSGAADGMLSMWDATTMPADITQPFATNPAEPDATVGIDDPGNDGTGNPDASNDKRLGDIHWELLSEDDFPSSAPPGALSLSADGRFALAAGSDAVVRLWNLGTDPYTLTTMEDHVDVDNPDGDNVNSVSLNADGSRALSGGLDGTVRLWETGTNTRHTFQQSGHTGGVNRVSLSADGSRALSGGEDTNVHLSDANTRALVHAMADHQHPVHTVALSGDGRRALSGDDGSGDDRANVRFWDTAAGTTLASLEDDLGTKLYHLSLNLDGSRAVTTYLPSGTLRIDTIRFWEPNRSPPTHISTAGRGVATTSLNVESSADGRLALSGATSVRAHLWNASTGEVLRILRGDGLFTLFTRSIALSADGRVALTGSNNRKIYLWRLGRSRSHSPPSTATATAGSDRTVAAGTTVMLDGSASSDLAGRALSAHSWRQTAGDAVVLSNANTAVTTFPAPDAAATLTFVLTVTDSRGLIATDEVTITVTAASSNALPP